MNKSVFETPQRDDENKEDRKRRANMLAQRKYRKKRHDEWQYLVLERKRLLLHNGEMEDELRNAKRAAAANNVEDVKKPPMEPLPLSANTPCDLNPLLQTGTTCCVGDPRRTSLSPTNIGLETDGGVVTGQNNSTPGSNQSETTNMVTNIFALSSSRVPPCSPPGGLNDYETTLNRLDVEVRQMSDRIQRIEQSMREILDKQTIMQEGESYKNNKIRRPGTSKGVTRKSLGRACKG